MSTLAVVALILGAVGGGALLAALAQMPNAAGQNEDPVGKWSSKRPITTMSATVPREFRSLLATESRRWNDPGTWEHLTKRLDELEIELGGQPSVPPTPEYSQAWLNSRLARIEALAGPAPTRPVLNRDAHS